MDSTAQHARAQHTAASRKAAQHIIHWFDWLAEHTAADASSASRHTRPSWYSTMNDSIPTFGTRRIYLTSAVFLSLVQQEKQRAACMPRLQSTYMAPHASVLPVGDALFQTHENMEHLAMMEAVLGSIPKSMAQASKGLHNCFIGRDFRLNWPADASKRSIRYCRLCPLHASSLCCSGMLTRCSGNSPQC